MRALMAIDGQLAVSDHEDPRPRDGEVLVRVHAAGLNAADLLQLRGRYAPPPGTPNADVLGLEFAGEVLAGGPRTGRFGPGDRVMAIVGGGAHAELVAVDERVLLAVPENVDLVSAGGFPEAFTTAHDALFTQAGLKVGERLLVHGAAGGVGTAAVQLGHAAGAEVVASVRNREHHEAVAALGARVIDPSTFVESGPFDVILELVGAPNLPGDIQALAPDGRISVIGTGAGAQAQVNLGALMVKRGRIYGSTLRARPLERKVLAADAVARDVLPLLQRGAIRVPIAETFALEDAAAAYVRFEAGGKLGKIILTV
ncbi:MAG: zinc-binding dehydrogenase [Solirubrobacteraceae bacterium]